MNNKNKRRQFGNKMKEKDAIKNEGIECKPSKKFFFFNKLVLTSSKRYFQYSISTTHS